MFRHASIIFGHHPIFPWRGRSGQKIFFEHEIFDGFQYWFDILGNRFGCVVTHHGLEQPKKFTNPWVKKDECLENQKCYLDLK